jgi:two-component system, LytTR family, sensor histidine kinase AlgZ
MSSQDWDWKKFWLVALGRAKHCVYYTAIVPVIAILMDPNFHQPGYWIEILHSTRIGFQISIFCWLSYTIFYGVNYRRDPDFFNRLRKSHKTEIGLGLAGMLIGLSVSSFFEPFWGGSRFSLQGLTSGLLIGGIILLAATFYSAHRLMTETNLKLRAESAETNLQVLKNQLQPHFLFNSLNSLSELIAVDREQAAQMTQALSELYREILESSKTNLSPLKLEFAIVRKYLELEKMRFGERLSYSLIEPPEPYRLQIPSLILQTLVENAVKHGVAPAIEGAEVEVRVHRNLDESYLVEVINSPRGITDFLPDSPKPSRPGATGLVNTKSRLDLLYGEGHGFQLEMTGGKTRASFTIPRVAV